MALHQTLDICLEIPQLAITAKLDRRPSDEHAFAQLSVRIGAVMFCNPDAWSVAGLVQRIARSLLEALQRQRGVSNKLTSFLKSLPAQALFEAIEDRAFGSGEWRYESEQPLGNTDIHVFFALPWGAEIFDGEAAYLILGEREPARLVCRDCESRAIRESTIDGKLYVRQWQSFLEAFDGALRRMELERETY
jgi:hypothetical protein